MPVLDGTPIGGREKIDPVASGKLNQVMIEIAGFLQVI